MPKPNLFIVGAPKCGTTAWVAYLSSHPDIFFSPVKEPHHFSTDRWSSVSITDRDEYEALFDQSGSAKIVGEGSVTYLYSEVAAENIRKYNPDARIIIFVRDQEDCLPSRHNQLVYNGVEPMPDFEQAWRLSGRRTGVRNARGLDYRAAGAFSPQIERYFSQFQADRIRVFHYRDWTRQPRETYVEILHMLGLRDDGRVDFPPINEARHHRTQLLVRLIRNPPLPVRIGVALVKRLTGRSRLGLADWAFGLGARAGSRTRISDSLKNEIREFFKADNALLERRIWVGEAQRRSRMDVRGSA